VTSRVAFLGSKEAGLRVLERVLATREAHVVAVACPDDRADARSRLDAFEERCRARDVPLTLVGKAAELDAWLSASAPGLALVSGWYQRIPVERHPDVAFFGLHASALPRYRGGAPIPWQIINGEGKVGLSFLELVAELDAGRIVAQLERKLTDEETIADALAWLEEMAPALVGEHLPALLRGDATLHAQDESCASYCSQRYPGDGLIDWRAPAARVHDFIRAQTRPYPGAFTRLADGRVVRVWRTALDPRPYLGPPGGVCERHPDRVVVACGEGALALLEVTVDGEPAPDGPAAVLDSLTVRLR
jgi:methionyl-tRNA formyltransferase